MRKRKINWKSPWILLSVVGAVAVFFGNWKGVVALNLLGYVCIGLGVAFAAKPRRTALEEPSDD